ncbi:MAG: hypothetical protein ACWGMZ_12705 [Thermoguttaceae bacterium]
MGDFIYIVNPVTGKLTKVLPVSFSEIGVKERQNLEEWVIANPDMLGEDLLVITSEFSSFDKSSRRIDILALDKRSGRTVYKNTFSSRVPRFLQVVGNEQDKTVDLILQGKTVTLTFTDKPYPSAEEIAKRLEAERLKTKKIKESVPRALFKSFGRGVLRLFGATEDDEEYMDEFDPASDGSGQ